MNKKDMNFLDKLISDKMFYLYICSMVSADTLINIETCEEILEKINTLKNEIPDSQLKTDKIIEYIYDAEAIVLHDLEIFKKKNNE